MRPEGQDMACCHSQFGLKQNYEFCIFFFGKQVDVHTVKDNTIYIIRRINIRKVNPCRVNHNQRKQAKLNNVLIFKDSHSYFLQGKDIKFTHILDVFEYRPNQGISFPSTTGVLWNPLSFLTYRKLFLQSNSFLHNHDWVTHSLLSELWRKEVERQRSLHSYFFIMHSMKFTTTL